MLSAYDRRLALRAAVIAGLAALLALLVVASTDESAPWARRLGMVAALAPVAGSIGALAALRIADGRGELRALAALGVDPVRVARGAILGGVLLSLLGPALAASGAADLGGLFPQPVAPRLWIAEGSGMRELTQGLFVGPGGALVLSAPAPRALSLLPWGASFFTIASLALTAILGPTWACAPGPRLGRLLAGAFALVVAIVAFQAVAIARLPAAALVAAPLILLIDGARARYLARRE